MGHKNNGKDKDVPGFLSEGIALRQGNWSSDVKRSPEALKWCWSQLKRCNVVYALSRGETASFEFFPQWTVDEKESKTVKNSANEKETLFMIGRVRKPWKHECSFDAVVEVAFRGTVNMQNWITNLDSALGPATMGKKQGQVHSGFARAYHLLQPGMMAKIEHALKAIGADWSKKLLVQATGHSLGGALATLASYDLGSRPGYTCICATFASPRVGDDDFVRSYNKVVNRTLRFVNQFDLVPKLPPETLKYRHTSPQIELDEDGVLAQMVKKNLRAALGAHPVVAHGVNEYLVNFAEFAAGQHVQKREAGSAFANWCDTSSMVVARQQKTRQQQTHGRSKDWHSGDRKDWGSGDRKDWGSGDRKGRSKDWHSGDQKDWGSGDRKDWRKDRGSGDWGERKDWGSGDRKDWGSGDRKDWGSEDRKDWKNRTDWGGRHWQPKNDGGSDASFRGRKDWGRQHWRE